MQVKGLGRERFNLRQALPILIRYCERLLSLRTPRLAAITLKAFNVFAVYIPARAAVDAQQVVPLPRKRRHTDCNSDGHCLPAKHIAPSSKLFHGDHPLKQRPASPHRAPGKASLAVGLVEVRSVMCGQSTLTRIKLLFC